MDNLFRARTRKAANPSQVVQTSGTQQSGFFDFERALLIEQRLLLLFQRFYFVARQNGTDVRSDDTGAKQQQHTRRSHGGPALSTRLRIRLPFEPGVIDP